MQSHNPDLDTKRIEVERKNRDIFDSFDVSRSMWANDVSPSRTLQAQRELLDFINILEGESWINCICQNPYPRMPFTTDYTMIEKQLLPEITPAYMESQGSDIPKSGNGI